jgi:hypothetical protein
MSTPGGHDELRKEASVDHGAPTRDFLRDLESLGGLGYTLSLFLSEYVFSLKLR